MEFQLTSNDGGYLVEVRATFLGKDLLVTCTGGDRPHIGAVALAHPQPAPPDSDEPGFTANIICLSGHREDELARASSMKLCRALRCTVTVVAGMHWEFIDRKGIDQVVANVESLMERLEEILKSSNPDQHGQA